MTTKNTGGPAFPLLNNKIGYHADIRQEWYGVTVRDYFAAKAMQAILPTITEFPDENWRIGVAMDSYAMADAMLKARENT